LQPPQPEKATESYSGLFVNPFDSQKMENALVNFDRSSRFLPQLQFATLTHVLGQY
jgi:hypothetical protein